MFYAIDRSVVHFQKIGLTLKNVCYSLLLTCFLSTLDFIHHTKVITPRQQVIRKMLLRSYFSIILLMSLNKLTSIPIRLL